MTTLTQRVNDLDWQGLHGETDAAGCAQSEQILTAEECGQIADMYEEVERFRSTVDMARHRFGSGQYRYFDYPLPEVVAELRAAFYPKLLPVARDWATKLRKPAPWPDTLDEWLDMCHDAGQKRATPILLSYRANDWNALHRDLYGDLVFPLQVVIGLDRPGVDHRVPDEVFHPGMDRGLNSWSRHSSMVLPGTDSPRPARMCQAPAPVSRR